MEKLIFLVMVNCVVATNYLINSGFQDYEGLDGFVYTDNWYNSINITNPLLLLNLKNDSAVSALIFYNQKLCQDVTIGFPGLFDFIFQHRNSDQGLFAPYIYFTINGVS